MAGTSPAMTVVACQRLWDVTRGKKTATLTGHTAAVRWLAFSPDGRALASRGADGALKLWDLPEPSQPARQPTARLTGCWACTRHSG